MFMLNSRTMNPNLKRGSKWVNQEYFEYQIRIVDIKS